MSQSTPALLVFRLMLSLAVSSAPLFEGEPVVVVVSDVFVAFFHSQMDALVCVHPPKDLVPSGCAGSWPAACTGSGGRAVLWAEHVRDVLQSDGGTMIRVIPMVVANNQRRYLAAVWEGDFTFVSSLTGMSHIARVVERHFESKLIGMFGTGCCAPSGRILNRHLAWAEEGIEWHADDKHSKAVVRRLELRGSSTPPPIPGSKRAQASM